jgi:threonylcarbamoyladenosine tRNA methylthiotransferase MtaB
VDLSSFRIISFGCKVNQAEGEALAAHLCAAGLAEAPDDAAADLLIINTCCVTAEAARQGRQRIRRAARSGAAVAVTGCDAHSAAGDEALRRIEGVRLVEADKRRLVEQLGARLSLAAMRPALDRSRALLKIQDGCPGGCTFCIVPLVRPVVRSLPPAEAARDLADLVAAGFREVVLCGIHLGLYGADLRPRATLPDLVGRLLSAPGEFRLRLSSIEPMEVTDALLERMAAEPERVCPHLHVPLQSGDDGVLVRMGRPYTAAEFLSMIERVRRTLERPAITADILVGFPSETDAAFKRTLAVCREAGLARIHVFPYSARPGTAAAAMRPQVPAETIRARRAEAAALGEHLAAAYRAGLVGTQGRVVVEKVGPDGSAEGLSERYQRVRIVGGLPSNAARRRQIVRVHLTRAAGECLEGEVLA